MIQYIFMLVMSFSGIITDIDVKDNVWVALKSGLVIEYPSGDTIIDIREQTWTVGEMGLLGIVRDSNLLYVNYSGYDSAQHIVVFPSETELFSISHKQQIGNNIGFSPNHKGGGMVISDSILYVGSGDGGFQGDPVGNAQNPDSPLGKVLSYNLQSGELQNLAIGVRNPWKISITGDILCVVDVGWNEREEFTFIPLNQVTNLGWPCYEGTYEHSTNCPPSVPPTYEYQHLAGGSAIIGGYKDSYGRFLIADHYEDSLWMIGTDTISQSAVQYLTVIKDGYAADYNGKLYELIPEEVLSQDIISFVVHVDDCEAIIDVVVNGSGRLYKLTTDWELLAEVESEQRIFDDQPASLYKLQAGDETELRSFKLCKEYYRTVPGGIYVMEPVQLRIWMSDGRLIHDGVVRGKLKLNTGIYLIQVQNNRGRLETIKHE